MYVNLCFCEMVQKVCTINAFKGFRKQYPLKKQKKTTTEIKKKNNKKTSQKHNKKKTTNVLATNKTQQTYSPQINHNKHNRHK